MINEKPWSYFLSMMILFNVCTSAAKDAAYSAVKSIPHPENNI